MLLSIENLKVRYGSNTVLSIEAPLEIQEGDRVGIIGSNGAGKSTLIKSILGLVPYQGRIRTELKPEQMAVHMQFNEYTDNMPVKYVMEAILNTEIFKDKKLQELIGFFEFQDCLKKKYSKLSGGQKQRFTIIMVMMQEAPLTFYDEVTSGLDFETRQKLVEKLEEWYRGKDTGFLMVSHYYEELDQLAEKLLILEEGHVVDFGKREELFHKYCGRAVVTAENTPRNQALLQGYEKMASPKHLLAISCGSQEVEKQLTILLLENNVNYKRSNNDIEMLYINAKERYYKGRSCKERNAGEKKGRERNGRERNGQRDDAGTAEGEV